MDSVKYILGKPEIIDGIEIYPIKVENYDEFMACVDVLLINKERVESKVEDELTKEQISELGDLEVVLQFGANDERIVEGLFTVLKLACKKEFNFSVYGDKYCLKTEDGSIVINDENYNDIRKTILKQNLIFEPKIYKDKIIEKWAMKVIKSRKKRSKNVTIEDVITTVKVFTGNSYDYISNQTIYQLRADYQRVVRFKNYDTTTLFRTVSEKPIDIVDFSEEIDMFEDPYDNLFVEKSKKVGKLNESMK